MKHFSKHFKLDRSGSKTMQELHSVNNAQGTYFRPTQDEPPCPPPPAPHPVPHPAGAPVLPYKFKSTIHVDERDLIDLRQFYSDWDDAYADAEIIGFIAPDEMRVLYIQLMRLYQEIAKDTGPFKWSDTVDSRDSTAVCEQKTGDSQTVDSQYPSPALGVEEITLFRRLYGSKADEFLKALRKAPKEIPILSKLIACLEDLYRNEV